MDGVSFSVERGSTLGIVGESGSGKSVTSLGIIGLHHRHSARISGEIWLDGEELVGGGPGRVRELRGGKMAMIFQDPLSALHPYYTVGEQIAEAYRVHHPGARRSRPAQRAVEMLGRVGIPQPVGPGGRVPAPVLRRHAAAGHDRHGPVLRSRAADRRRADHRARRHRAGADPRPDRETCRPSSARRSSSSPTISAWSPRWPTRSWSCTPAGQRARHRRRRLQRPAAPLHLGPAGLGAAPGPSPPHRLAPIPGTPPSLIDRAVRLPVPPALPVLEPDRRASARTTCRRCASRRRAPRRPAT